MSIYHCSVCADRVDSDYEGCFERASELVCQECYNEWVCDQLAEFKDMERREKNEHEKGD